MAGDFWLELTIRIDSYPSVAHDIYAILEDGIYNVVGGNFAIYLGDGKLVVVMAGTPDCNGNGCALASYTANTLQTSQITLGTDVVIVVERMSGTCSLAVDGATVVTTQCTSTALIPAPSSSNQWNYVGVGAQKDATASCASKYRLFPSSAGSIKRIRLLGGRVCWIAAAALNQSSGAEFDKQSLTKSY